MAVTRLYKTFDVEGELAPYRIATFAETSGMIAQASDPGEALLGTTDELGLQSNGRADIAMSAQPEVEAGEVLALGDPLTTDAEGRAVKATATGQHIIGYALGKAEAAGDIIDYLYAPAFLVLAAAAPATPPKQEGEE